jgi:hypothetical protein
MSVLAPWRLHDLRDDDRAIVVVRLHLPSVEGFDDVF